MVRGSTPATKVVDGTVCDGATTPAGSLRRATGLSLGMEGGTVLKIIPPILSLPLNMINVVSGTRRGIKPVNLELHASVFFCNCQEYLTAGTVVTSFRQYA
jgi:hypothetical protein